jgi:hypothetical protein
MPGQFISASIDVLSASIDVLAKSTSRLSRAASPKEFLALELIAML